ncbi:unnamed protein product [Sphagnum tenellum]
MMETRLRIEELRPLPRNCGTRDRTRDSQGSYKRAQAISAPTVFSQQAVSNHLSRRAVNNRPSNSLDPHTHSIGFNKSLTSELFTSPTSP